MSQAEGQIVHAVQQGWEHLEFFGKGTRAHELTEVVKQHALLGVAAGMIPIPGADLAALAANTWTMYVRINNVVGISFSENALRSVASGVIANLATAIPGVLIAEAAGSFLKLIPGIGTLGGIAVQAAANVAVLYVAGTVYIKALEKLVVGGHLLTEENVKRAAAETARDTDFVKEAYSEGKNVASEAHKKS